VNDGAINARLRELYSRYIEVLEGGDAEEALEVGVEILEELLLLTRKHVLESIANPAVKEVAIGVLLHYERELSFVRGAREALRSTPPLYAAAAAEKALETLSSCINGLFNFAVGALLVLADVFSCISLQQLS